MAKKGFDYFKAFAGMVDCAVEASALLEEEINDFHPDKVEDVRARLHVIENSADRKKHELMDNLSREFVPPIEREDIAHLASEIDEVVDCIEDVYLRIYMYNMTEIPQEAKRFTRIISMCCRTLRDVMEEFPKFRKSDRIGALIVDVNSMEEEGDKLYVEGLHKLYGECTDAVWLLTLTYCFERLEKCCDACEHVANVTESVIMKNS
ncbi:MAG: DUF47 family protein [Clostridia bacterium]|nr:DUF47 family protein [Clostridia bacterium]